MYGAWLYNLPQRLGRREGEADLWEGGGQVQGGAVPGALGLHPLHRPHLQCPRIGLSGLHAGRQTSKPPTEIRVPQTEM